MNDISRWIMVSDGTPQMMYAGKTKLEEEEIDRKMEAGSPLELSDCRAMRTLMVPGQAPGSITLNEMLAPLSISRAGIRLKVKAMAYFWPDEHPSAEKVFLEKVKLVEKAEITHRAAEAGLLTMNAAPPHMGGKLLS